MVVSVAYSLLCVRCRRLASRTDDGPVTTDLRNGCYDYPWPLPKNGLYRLLRVTQPPLPQPNPPSRVLRDGGLGQPTRCLNSVRGSYHGVGRAATGPVKNLIPPLAKKSWIARQHRRECHVATYASHRAYLKAQAELAPTLTEKFVYFGQLQALPRDSSRTRLKNRCNLTGRSRAYTRDFGLSRHMLRALGHQGLLPGLTKSSW